jgi:hypothetical protein
MSLTKRKSRTGSDSRRPLGSNAKAYYFGLSAYILSLIKKVNATFPPNASENVYVCMVHDRLTTQNTGILSSGTEASDTAAAFAVQPLATSWEKTDAEFIRMKNYCAGLPGQEASVDDPVQCRGFCKPTPKICVGEGAESKNRYCRISNYQGNYLHFRLYDTYDPLFHKISKVPSRKLHGATVGGCSDNDPAGYKG